MQQAQSWRKRLGPALFLAASMVAALVWPAATMAQTETRHADSSPAWLLNQINEMPIPPFRPGAVLVALRGEATSAAAAWEGLAVAGVEALALRGLAVDGEPATILRLRVPAGDEWATLERLAQDPAVLFAEPDWLVRTADALLLPPAAPESPILFGDPLYLDQWYLARMGFARAWGVAHGEADAPLQTIQVAVIDTGVDLNHPALAGRLLMGRNYLSKGAAPNDDNGHGTHVTGVIAAVTGRNGMVGIAPAVRINPLKVLDASGVGWVSAVAEAVRDAADGDAHLINLSLQMDVESALLRAAIDYAVERGALIIAAAGNCISSCPVPVRYPARFPNVIAVAASTYSDTRAFFSAVGPELDLATPGGGAGYSILSAWPAATASRCRAGLRQAGGGYYCLADGTSMAAGITSGVAALVWSMRPELSAAQVRALLKTATIPIGPPEEVGAGRLDAAAAARLALVPRLRLPRAHVHVTVRSGSGPVAVALPLENPSLEPLEWAIRAVSDTNWYTATGMIGGSVRYGSAVAATAVLTPAVVGTGSHLGAFWLSITRTGHAPTGTYVPVQLDIIDGPLTVTAHLPLTARAWAAPQWAAPRQGAPRRVYTLDDNGSAIATLPFTLASHGYHFASVRIHADGVVTLPGDFAGGLPSSRCLAHQPFPPLAIYGWWADLDPARGGQVSTFQPDADHFVIEYDQIRSAAGVFPAYTVSFQIVIRRDGAIMLHYGDTPQDDTPQDDTPRTVTVGVAAGDGRFYNQIACVTPGVRYGRLPHSGQTLIIRPEDLF